MKCRAVFFWKGLNRTYYVPAKKSFWKCSRASWERAMNLKRHPVSAIPTPPWGWSLGDYSQMPQRSKTKQWQIWECLWCQKLTSLLVIFFPFVRLQITWAYSRIVSPFRKLTWTDEICKWVFHCEILYRYQVWSVTNDDTYQDKDEKDKKTKPTSRELLAWKSYWAAASNTSLSEISSRV